MAKKLELKFLTSANTELIVSIADPKDGLALSAVQAEAAKSCRCWQTARA